MILTFYRNYFIITFMKLNIITIGNSKGVTAAHGGLDGPGDEGADLAAVGGRGGPKAGLFIVDETAIPGIRGARQTHIVRGIA